MPSVRRVHKLAPLLFGSGLCALVYQITWFREFRLIFGASTGATAAVLAVFMGGLGAGGFVLGRRADRHPRPVAMYSNLELLIALSAAVTPGLLRIARVAYLALGGEHALGWVGATALRLVLATLVLALPTFLMGGTLPAAASGVEYDDDPGRRDVGLLYGANTLGAVTGSLLATFLMLEVFGTQITLWLACLLNVLVAMIARPLGRTMITVPGAEHPEAALPETSGESPAWFTLVASAVVGFAFLLMELVWYRMLAPILGGTVFTFGLILSWALLGIGLGGIFYATVKQQRPPSLLGFAYTCLLEAACLAGAYAMGDRIAVLALLLRSLGAVGFSGYLIGWSVVTSIVVLPAAFVSGVQFPMLIALLGRGRANVGMQIGRAYACNTIGAILGSLAGGFGLLPLLSAPGCWRGVSLLLAALGIAAIVLAIRTGSRARELALPTVLAIAVGLLVRTTGPTAAWRHTPIGNGRVSEQSTKSSTLLRDWIQQARRSTIWEADGVESSVAVEASTGLAFVINGKTDGHVLVDAPTQVMGGLVGAAMIPTPSKAMVIGLGTGSTAGWLAAVPTMQRVDVIELEPAILHVAKLCAPVNRNVLDNPKVKVALGDAREALLTSTEKYDIVFSEPSNPYRAGIAGLFTQEYYRAVIDRLEPGGLFLQWVQAYDIDTETLRTIYATLGSVFPNVETWELAKEDLLLLASKEPVHRDIDELRERLQSAPYREALVATWRTDSVEGFLSHFVAGPSFVRAIAREIGDQLNTDDQNYVEFGFARSVGREGTHGEELRRLARHRGESRPAIQGVVDWELVADEGAAFSAVAGFPPESRPEDLPERRHRITALMYYANGNLPLALAAWRSQQRLPSGLTEIAMVAEGMAETGDEGALDLTDKLRAYDETEAEAIVARLHLRKRRFAEAAASLEKAFSSYRSQPWAPMPVMQRALALAQELPHDQGIAIARVFASLKEPFSVHMIDNLRLKARLHLSAGMDPASCVEAVSAYEPHVPWQRDVLSQRAACYSAAHLPGAERARDDFAEYLAAQPTPIDIGLSLPEGTSEAR